MKKFLSILMVFALIFASMLVFASCGGNGDGDNGDDGDSFELGSVTEQPSGYKLYENNNVAFYYPASLTTSENVQGNEGSVAVIDLMTGSSLSLTYGETEEGEEYEPMTLGKFESTFVAALNAEGYEVSKYEELAPGVYRLEYDRGGGIIITQTMAFIYNSGVRVAGIATVTTSSAFETDPQVGSIFINSIRLFKKTVN
ncbi:MAG: hypothetical protein IJW54_05375 [Clostridia bacterium]|nr:hypothetical protein [Clostridia bacterium]